MTKRLQQLLVLLCGSEVWAAHELCETRRCIGGKPVLFIHIPKTGGTTIENDLKRIGFDVGMFFPWPTNYTGPDCFPWHTPPRYFHSIDFSDFITFTVVRDPIDRFFSEENWRNHKEIPSQLDELQPATPFPQVHGKVRCQNCEAPQGYRISYFQNCPVPKSNLNFYPPRLNFFVRIVGAVRSKLIILVEAKKL